jgi:hypothetical protein
VYDSHFNGGNQNPTVATTEAQKTTFFWDDIMKRLACKAGKIHVWLKQAVDLGEIRFG